MPRILFAWELGSNLGHLTRDLPLARACRQAGYEVVLAVPDLPGAATFLAQERFTLVQAPLLQARRRRPLPPINYADMLLHEGYDDIAALEGALQGWEGLFALARPDLMIYNHAPTALLAARASRVPVLLLGTGFEIPPASHPLPSFRPWEDIAVRRLTDVETHCLFQINSRLTRRRQAGITGLRELFPPHEVRLTTFPELDPFGPRHNVSYIGAPYALPTMPEASWHTDRGRHIFAYMRPSIPGCEFLLCALQQLDDEVVCVVPDLPSEWPSRFNALRFIPHSVALNVLLERADLVITYGAGTIATALLAAVPVLLIPQVIEQYLCGLALEAMGGGLMLREERTSEICTELLGKLLHDSRYRRAAEHFAEKYRHSDAGNVWQTVREALR